MTIPNVRCVITKTRKKMDIWALNEVGRGSFTAVIIMHARGVSTTIWVQVCGMVDSMKREGRVTIVD